MSIKILATSDLHLGKRSSGVIGEHASTKVTLNKIVEYCIEKSIDVLLLCGDIVDRDNRFFEAYGPLQEAFDRLGKHHIKVYLIAGNHDFDVLPQIINNGNNQHVYLLGQNETWEVLKFTKKEQTIQFVGWSFAKRFVKESPMLTWDPSLIDSNFQTIGLLHGDIDIANSPYAPIRLDELLKSNINLWLFGHIHKPQQLADYPLVWYTGSPHALSAKEPDIHGPLLIVVEPNQPMKIEKIRMSPVRYEYLSINITGVDEESQLREKVIYSLNKDAEEKIEQLEEVKSLVYHIKLIGKSSYAKKIDDWKRTIIEYSVRLETGTIVGIRKVDSQISPNVIDLVTLAQQASPAGILANTILSIEEERTTPFLDNLTKDWVLKIEGLNRAGVYNPLSLKTRQLELSEVNARKIIKDECNRLLGELMNQITERN